MLFGEELWDMPSLRLPSGKNRGHQEPSKLGDLQNMPAMPMPAWHFLGGAGGNIRERKRQEELGTSKKHGMTFLILCRNMPGHITKGTGEEDIDLLSQMENPPWLGRLGAEGEGIHAPSPTALKAGFALGMAQHPLCLPPCPFHTRRLPLKRGWEHPGAAWLLPACAPWSSFRDTGSLGWWLWTGRRSLWTDRAGGTLLS